MNHWHQQTQALAGIMQAVCQIEDIASRGVTDSSATRTSVVSVLQQSADDLNRAVGTVGQLRYGLRRIQELLQGEQKYLPALQYAMAVMQLQRNLRRSDKLQQVLASELQLINMSIAEDNPDVADAQTDERDSDLDEVTVDPAPELVAQLADVWSSQVRKLEPQVVVHGKPLYLQNESNIQLIRTLLLAALRCAWLWHQLGGRRWHLLLRRKRLLQDVHELLADSD